MTRTMPDIQGVEIFKAGTWNGDTYTIDDLDLMIDAFGKVGFRPPVKLGHTKDSGARAFGWVENLRRIGDKLIADFTNVPSKLLELIRARAFDAVSAEVGWNMERNGKVFPRVLRAVALLGAAIPAVAGLRPVSTSIKGLPASGSPIPDPVHPLQEWSGLAVKTYLFEFPSVNTMHMDNDRDEDPGLRMHELIEAHAFDNNCDYATAMHAVMADPSHGDLVRQYAHSEGTRVHVYQEDEEEPQDRVGEDVDRAIRKYMTKTGCTDYSEGFNAVLSHDGTLRELYGRSGL